MSKPHYNPREHEELCRHCMGEGQVQNVQGEWTECPKCAGWGVITISHREWRKMHEPDGSDDYRFYQ